jgi:hypothetical protein
MKNKVREFPKPASFQAEVPTKEPMVLFTLGDQRFAVQWIITELRSEPAEVIPLQKKRQDKKRQR